jgi:hypothetical protein
MIHERRRQENFAQTIHSTIEDEVDKKADISPAIGRTACPYEGVSGVNQLFFCRILILLVLPFASSPIHALCRLRIPRFTLANIYFPIFIILINKEPLSTKNTKCEKTNENPHLG